MKTMLIWPTLADLENAAGYEARVALACSMWGCCYLEEAPAYFGRWMVRFTELTGVSASPEKVSAAADEIIENARMAKS